MFNVRAQASCLSLQETGQNPATLNIVLERREACPGVNSAHQVAELLAPDGFYSESACVTSSLQPIRPVDAALLYRRAESCLPIGPAIRARERFMDERFRRERGALIRELAESAGP